MLLAGVAAALLWLAPAQAREQIVAFVSLIEIARDGSVTVTEEITVDAEGEHIRRGIYREFPTDYRDRFGNAVRVAFDVLEVRRDGRSEPYHLAREGGAVRVYMGDAGARLSPGRYTYTLSYRTDRQIGFFDGFDELYWNVTGDGWAFPILEARATVVPPPGAEPLDAAVYTGPRGARESDARIARGVGRSVVFTATRTLAPGEGMTVAVSWPKGHVDEPGTAQRLAWLLADNATALAALIGVAAVLIYYLMVWARVGRDPPEGTVFPRFEPPGELSPAAMRFVRRMGFDDKAFAAALVDMAVKGHAVIEEDGDGFAIRRKSDGHGTLSPGERALHAALFAGGDRVALERGNHRVVGAARTALRKRLKDDLEKTHFRHNRLWLVPGIGMTVLTLLAVVAVSDEPFSAGFMSVWLAGWTAGVAVLLVRVAAAWRAGTWMAAVFLTLFTLPFLIGEGMGLLFFAQAASGGAAVLLLVAGGVNALFYHLMKAPTLHGRRVLDEIEGLRMYMEVAEKDRMDALHPPERTPERFERLLPYALALDVENQWSEQFADVLEAAKAPEGGYSPTWYSGRSWTGLGRGGLASALGGAFAGAAGAAAAAPGSSSGSGGGGSSGGGGGGGGGGGW